MLMPTLNHICKRLASLLSEKLDLSHGEVTGCKLSFSFIMLVIMYIWGA